ncbi:MAG: hypothetical protein FJZ66_01945 [Bacteroidetes bacterium]|nr:hypothetical protein [Bacteroidota bacterium]
MRGLSFFVIVLISCNHYSQATKQSFSRMFEVEYGANLPAGDLAQRYGFLNHVGGGVLFRSPQNLIFGFESAFIFGNQFKSEFDSVFSHLSDAQGNITDINGDIALVMTYARGFYANGFLGKLIQLSQKKKASHLQLKLGFGYLQHRFRIETNQQVVPQIETDYRKGYDRFTTGINTSQFIGYAFLPEEGFYQFYGGLYIQEGFTYNRRTINFDQPNVPVSRDLRLDLQIGVKLGWYIPFYKAEPRDYYFE